MYFYLTEQTCNYPVSWFKVLEGPFQDKESLKVAALKEIRAANSYDEAVMVDQMILAATLKRIRVNKSIRGDWLSGSNSFKRSTDSEIKKSYGKMCKEFFSTDY